MLGIFQQYFLQWFIINEFLYYDFFGFEENIIQNACSIFSTDIYVIYLKLILY